MIPQCPACLNLRRHANKVFSGLATNVKGTMGWCHGIKLRFVSSDGGEIITLLITGTIAYSRDPKVWNVLVRTLYRKLFTEREHISPRLFDMLFEDGIHLVKDIKTNMKNWLMPMWDKIMLKKRCIIETINDLQRNTTQLVHSRHRSVNNFFMNMVAALAAYCFFYYSRKHLMGTILRIPDNLCCFENSNQELG